MPPSVKNRIRSLNRLLAKQDLPKDVRAVKLKELAGLEMKSEERKQQERDKKITLKYRTVRFFERRKIVRKIDQVKKKLASLTSDSTLQSEEETTLRTTLAKLNEDLSYIVHFPKGTKYVSLFAVDSQGSEQRRNELRAQIQDSLSARSSVQDQSNNGDLDSFSDPLLEDVDDDDVEPSAHDESLEEVEPKETSIPERNNGKHRRDTRPPRDTEQERRPVSRPVKRIRTVAPK